ncbi:restriction endonuclease subunit S [Synechococcus sp. PCC 6312]|uniref:restriction endonuclease subunit S n=1 Tax=Synechococcus sp. (strain ATCC 27167 / PCC 6312) TaxID=195253 RepID=UPI00029F20F2|nr:restriction endonuclease subunit S [Synechococcus sp. PCC 6312]AFY60251.1 restriction endonuclease S subunit [Synechococcus sp. PCC 6312]
MKPKNNHSLLPKLRFPEFRDAGEWEIKKLGQLGELVSGLTYSPEDIRDQGLLVLRSSNIQNGMIALDDSVFVRPDIQGVNLSRPNDILICVRNGSKSLIGKNALIPEKMPLCTHGAFMTVFRTNTAKFIFQLFQTEAYEKQVSADLGATINSINGGHLKKYKFYIPKLDEQQKIADCLTSIDDLIAAETQKLESLKSHKKGLMQQLFPAEGETIPKLRFPEFRDAGAWEEKKIEDLAKRGSGHTPNKGHTNYYNGGIKWVSLADSNKLDKGYIYDTKVEISVEGIKNSSAVIHPPGTVIISRDAGVGKSAVLYSGMAVSQHFIAWCCDKSKLSNWFLYFLLQILKPTFERIATGSTIKTIGLPYFKEIRITIPSINEQQKIADFLSSLDDLITAQTQKIEALKLHKKGLMQQLFPSVEEVEHE